MGCVPSFIGKCAGVKKVIKGAWRMPWLTEAMKDVISCGKVQITFDPRISEWDNPPTQYVGITAQR